MNIKYAYNKFLNNSKIESEIIIVVDEKGNEYYLTNQYYIMDNDWYWGLIKSDAVNAYEEALQVADFILFCEREAVQEGWDNDIRVSRLDAALSGELFFVDITDGSDVDDKISEEVFSLDAIFKTKFYVHSSEGRMYAIKVKNEIAYYSDVRAAKDIIKGLHIDEKMKAYILKETDELTVGNYVKYADIIIYCIDNDYASIVKDKKSNARYWDGIDNTVLDAIQNVLASSLVQNLSYGNGDNDEFDLAEEVYAEAIIPEIRDKVVSFLERYGALFPYVDENM